MFRLTRPTAAEIDAVIATAEGLPQPSARFLSLQRGLKAKQLPPFFAHDYTEAVLGRGETAFALARRAFQSWVMFDLGWVRVANPAAQIALSQIVAVEALSLGLWTINLSRIAEVIDEPVQFGFVYITTPIHVEEGEERFLLEVDAASGEIRYVLEAVSRPRDLLARLGLPITRTLQHRFARASQARMRESVASLSDRSQPIPNTRD